MVAAKEVLEQEDVARFTMRDVAERADISLANVQYYYKTRRATLLAAVIEGLMIVGGEQDMKSPSTRSLLKSAEALAFRIALRDHAPFLAKHQQ
ncbi:MAG: TetR family transcriptional regulator [Gammaproteobacteria bacterium]|jgi:AcrR family transcriptional regulator|nr:TetR family transcriptional regulator [Gammaproteobacteria bacterium]MBT5603912.1 TetR family transcriptional regulator [Gammaproteobacteria bacterium]MBT6244677.1 TetR family transcriptional regulator [Gammaproteobacteria bacterium]